MQIIYFTKCPLFYKIKLTDLELEIVRLRIRLSSMVDYTCLETKANLFSQEKISKFIEDSIFYSNCIFDIVDKEEEFFQTGNFTSKLISEELEKDHEGDCTRQCAPCIRCYIEEFLGVETPFKRYNFKVRNIVFNCWRHDSLTFEEMIDLIDEKYPDSPEAEIAKKAIIEHRDFMLEEKEKVLELPLLLSKIQ